MNIDRIRQKLSAHESVEIVDPEPRRAAVALILRERGPSSEVLFIERAQREGDPWSGHMAFPGGREEPADQTMLDAAIRETREEVGIDLSGAEHLGHLEDLMGTRRVAPRLVVSAHAFHLDADQPFALDPKEVESVHWCPLSAFHERERWVDHRIPEMPKTAFPGVSIGEAGRHVVWGLTYRFLDRFFEVLERPLPNRWGELNNQRDA